jgi:ubiquinone/menaquinone biosynthesis C-methylase UbiE
VFHYLLRHLRQTADTSLGREQYADAAEKFTVWYAEKLVKAAKLDQISDDEDLVVLDLACGTGIVSKSLTDVLNDKQKANLDLTCADFADSMVDFAGPRVQTFGVKSAQAVKADAIDTKLPGDKFSHILLNFGPMIYTDGQAGFRELHRLLQPNGTLAMSSWKNIGWIDDVQAAFASDPEIPQLAYEDFRKVLNQGGVWDDPAWIKENVEKANFQDVQVREVPHKSSLKHVDEFAKLMAGMVGMIQGRM